MHKFYNFIETLDIMTNLKKTHVRAGIIAEKEAVLSIKKEEAAIKKNTEYIDENDENSILNTIAPQNLYLFYQWEQSAIRNENIPLDLFPKIFREYGKELLRILSSENNFIIGGMIAAMSGAIGNSIRLYSANYINVPCFYIACIGNSGANKSETIRRLMQPLTTIESRLNEEYDAEAYNYKKNKDDLGFKTDVTPIRQSLILTSGTMESIYDLMQNNEKGISLFRAELKGFFDELNQFRIGADIPNWLQIWSREGFNITRKSIPGGGYRIENPFVSIIGMIQTDKFKEVVNSKIGISDGFLWRFLPCLATKEKRVRIPSEKINKEIEDRYNNFIVDIYDYLYMNTLQRNLKTDKLKVNPIPLYLDVQASLLYDDWQAFCADRWNKTPNEQIRQMINKIEIYCYRFAIILHIAEHGTNLKNFSDIGVNTMGKACQLAEYFLQSMQNNFDQVSGESEKTPGLTNKYDALYKAIRSSESITTHNAKVLGKEHKISERRVDEFLKRKDMFKKIGHGLYIKSINL